MLFFKLIEVCRIPYQSFVVKLFYRRIAGYHVHRLAAEEMYKLSFYLCRAARLVRTERLGLLFVPDQLGSAVGTCFREVRLCDIRSSLAQLYPCNLRDDLASFLYVDIVAYVDIELLHLVGIVQGSTLHHGSAQLYRLQICDRSHRSCPADLVVYAEQLGQCLLCLELVGYSPSRELGCVA